MFSGRRLSIYLSDLYRVTYSAYITTPFTNLPRLLRGWTAFLSYTAPRSCRSNSSHYVLIARSDPTADRYYARVEGLVGGAPPVGGQ